MRALLLVGLAGCFAPQSGTYAMDPVGDAESDCSTDPGDASSGEMDIDVDDDEKGMDLTVSVDVGGTPTDFDFDCDLDGRAFDCDGETDPVDLRPFGSDAVLRWAFSFDGRWTSNTSIEGTETIDYTCEGGDCSTYGESCSATQDWEGELDE